MKAEQYDLLSCLLHQRIFSVIFCDPSVLGHNNTLFGGDASNVEQPRLLYPLEDDPIGPVPRHNAGAGNSNIPAPKQLRDMDEQLLPLVSVAEVVAVSQNRALRPTELVLLPILQPIIVGQERLFSLDFSYYLLSVKKLFCL